MGKTKHELKVERAKYEAEVRGLLEKYDTDGSKTLDADEVRKLIEELDKAPPLAKDVNWVMKMGDKDGGGTIAFGELFVVLQKYKKYRHDNPDLVRLIAKHDKNKDMVLSSNEMRALLQDVSEENVQVSDADVESVMEEFQSLSLGAGSSKGIDPDSLAKAISNWQDRKIDELSLFGISMPKMEVPKFEPPNLSAATSWTDGIFGCCGSPDDKATKRKSGKT
mmetsp:Transcript_8642/g.20187  ORF Transcript_8642/g.20187 Transcript_8642/m.20187 type:complete len:222 (+) Transcript_8642:46-711(+)